MPMTGMARKMGVAKVPTAIYIYDFVGLQGVSNYVMISLSCKIAMAKRKSMARQGVGSSQKWLPQDVEKGGNAAETVN